MPTGQRENTLDWSFLRQIIGLKSQQSTCTESLASTFTVPIVSNTITDVLGLLYIDITGNLQTSLPLSGDNQLATSNNKTA